jgi:hypothetical protein
MGKPQGRVGAALHLGAVTLPLIEPQTAGLGAQRIAPVLMTVCPRVDKLSSGQAQSRSEGAIILDETGVHTGHQLRNELHRCLDHHARSPAQRTTRDSRRRYCHWIHSHAQERIPGLRCSAKSARMLLSRRSLSCSRKDIGSPAQRAARTPRSTTKQATAFTLMLKKGYRISGAAGMRRPGRKGP